MASILPPAPHAADRLVGSAISLGFFTGGISLLVGLLALLRGEWVAVGMCLIAAALVSAGLSIALSRP